MADGDAERQLDIATLRTTSRFDGYLTRQDAAIRRRQELESRNIPVWLSNDKIIPGLHAR
jgi:hypothetical protein